MKKIKLAILLFLLSISFANAFDITPIDYVKNQSKNEDFFIIKGILTSKINQYEYTFQDSSGTSNLEIDDFAFKDINDLPLNTEITLKVTVDKKIIEYPKIKVFEIVEIADNTSNFDPSSLVITDIPSIKATSKVNDIFVIEGSIIPNTDENNDLIYEFEDNNGNTVLLNIKDSIFQNADITGFNNNDKVILEVKVLRNVSGNLELDVSKILKLNNDLKP